MREFQVATRALEGPDGTRRALRYFVLVEDIQAAGRFLYESYGVRVTLSGSRSAPPESRSIHNVTLSARRIDELLERLVGGAVTPAALMDVLSDWAQSA